MRWCERGVGTEVDFWDAEFRSGSLGSQQSFNKRLQFQGMPGSGWAVGSAAGPGMAHAPEKG